MTCYHPLLAYRSEGKVVFNKPFAFAKGFNLPCGQCIGCRLNYSRQWAIRIMHEAEMHDENCFITLTFDQANLEKRSNPLSLDVSEYQRFMKRLRKRFGKNIRFFHCGEYGEKNKRPHYHAIIFGLDFKDKVLFSKRDGIRLYTSEALQELWPYGFSTIGEVTFQSAAYVARYIMKKWKGEGAEDHYTRWCPETGEGTPVDPEYCTMSRGNNLPEDHPNATRGIGYSWLQKFKADVYPHDYVVINNHKVKPPRYYDSLLSEEELAELKKKRAEDAPEVIDEYNEAMDRLMVSEEIKIKRLELLIRNL
jgi:hypothetical protein